MTTEQGSMSEVLVDTTAYGVPGLNWCRVLEVLFGTGATYPIKVKVPGRGVGQYHSSEIVDQRVQPHA